MKRFALALSACMALLLLSCVASRVLNTRGVAEPSGAEGLYSLVLFGGTSSSDLETLAVLDIEGDGYGVFPDAPAFRYKVEKGLGISEALERARHFLSLHPSFWKLHFRMVEGPEGRPIAYEIRPLYTPFAFADSNVLDTTYLLEEGEFDGVKRLRLIVRLKREVEEREFLREKLEERR